MAAFVREETERGDVLHVVGEVDLANAAEFESALGTFTEADPMVVDLTACSYLDSSGLRVLSTVYKDTGSRLRIVIPKGGSVHRIFEITGLDQQFHVSSTVDEAFSQTPGQPSR